MAVPDDAFPTRDALEAAVKAYATEIFDFDRPDAVAKKDWDGKVLAHLAEHYMGDTDWYSSTSRDVKRTRTVTKTRKVHKDALKSVPTGIRVFAGIFSFGTTELAGVAASTQPVSEDYMEDEEYTETETEFRWNKDKFRLWKKNASAALGKLYSRQQQRQDAMDRMQSVMDELSRTNKSHAREIEALRRQLQNAIDSTRASEQGEMMRLLNKRLDEVERQLRDGEEITSDDFTRWNNGVPMRSI